MMHTTHLSQTTGATLAFADQGIDCDEDGFIEAAPENTFYGGRCMGLGNIVYDIVSNDANFTFDYYVLEVEGTSETNPTEPRCNYGGVNVIICEVDGSNKPQEVCGPILPSGIDDSKGNGGTLFSAMHPDKNVMIFEDGEQRHDLDHQEVDASNPNLSSFEHDIRLNLRTMLHEGEISWDKYHILMYRISGDSREASYSLLEEISMQEFNSTAALAGMALESAGEKIYVPSITGVERQTQSDDLTLSDLMSNDQISIFPNPLEGHLLHLALDYKEEFSKATIYIYNALGNLMYENSVFETPTILDLGSVNLQPGIYSMVVWNGTRKETKNLIVIP